MRKLDLSSSFFLLAFAMFAGATAIYLGVGTLKQPGPGFFPFGGAILIGLSSLITLFQALAAGNEEPEGEKARKNWVNVILVLVAGLVFAVLLEPVGFALCTFLLMFFFLRVIASARWSRALLTAVIVAVVSYLIFNVALDAQLPKGWLGF